MEQKPKYTSSRFNDMLINQATQAIEKASVKELMEILQGFRKRASRDIYLRIRKEMIRRRASLLPAINSEDNDVVQKAETLANFFFTFASNIPNVSGVYIQYFKDDINELLSHYEEDLKECVQYLDAEHLTRLSQALYLLKSTEYETIFWRIEERVNELKDKLDAYHVTNILRSFSKSQQNKTNGKDKTFYNLEPIVLKNLDKLNDRDATHLMYAYSVRNVGNPELHKAFEKKLTQIADRLDYPSMFNAIYYMLFTENMNEEIWKKIVDCTVQNPDILPLRYYKPFKASKIILQAKLPKIDLTDYIDKFWYAERYFSVIKFEDLLYSDKKYFNFKAFLN